jgi:ubiquinone/menaquinone biosynthesis C-methylase UbiE
MNSQYNDYWVKFWSEYQTDVANKDEHSQVLRTRNKQPIEKYKWDITLSSVHEQLELCNDDILLDLCCGNGLFSAAFSNYVNQIEAVDISSVLTERLANRKLHNVNVTTSDMRTVNFTKARFNKVLWYAGIQYIDESDIIAMIRKIKSWMKPGGILLIGDIPDRNKLWNYFNDDIRQSAYFTGLLERKPIIGTWIDAEWIEKSCIASGFISSNAMPQHPELIYSDFRFDLIART